MSVQSSKDTQSENNANVDLEAQLKRALADYQNLQKRFEKEKQEVVKFANEVLLMKLLGITEGFEMLMKQLNSLLEEHGFEKVPIQEGEAFDAQTMEAIDGEGKHVDEIYSYPYRLHDKIVKHGRVKVRKD